MITKLLPVLLLLLAAALIFGYIRPTYANGIVAAQTQIKSDESALTAAKKFKDREAELATERAAIPTDSISRLESFLPDSVDNVQLILDLNALASRSDVTLSDFGIDAATQPAGTDDGSIALDATNPVDSYQISVTASGGYTAFRSFLQGLEHSLRPMDVVNLDVKAGDSGAYTYTMTIRIYSLH